MLIIFRNRCQNKKLVPSHPLRVSDNVYFDISLGIHNLSVASVFQSLGSASLMDCSRCPVFGQRQPLQHSSCVFPACPQVVWQLPGILKSRCQGIILYLNCPRPATNISQKSLDPFNGKQYRIISWLFFFQAFPKCRAGDNVWFHFR